MSQRKKKTEEMEDDVLNNLENQDGRNKQPVLCWNEI